MLTITRKTSSRTLLMLVAVLLECTGCMSNNKGIHQSNDTKANLESAKADDTADDVKAAPGDTKVADDTAMEDALPDSLIDEVSFSVLKRFLREFKKGRVKIDDPIKVDARFLDDTQNYTALQLAARENNVELLKGLLKVGANPNAAIDHDRETALHIAARCNYVEIVKVLVDAKGADINQQRAGDFTPLHVAIRDSCIEVVKVLSQHKHIDFTKKDFQGQTPLCLARNLLYSDSLASILEKNGAKE